MLYLVKTSNNSSINARFSSGMLDMDERIVLTALVAIGCDERSGHILPELEPLTGLDKWWVELDDEWKDVFRKELSLGEAPKPYYLKRVKSIQKIVEGIKSNR